MGDRDLDLEEKEFRERLRYRLPPPLEDPGLPICDFEGERDDGR
jgi:hypothetical protein